MDQRASSAGYERSLGSKKILVVEDEQIVALDLQERVRTMGYSALVAATGEEAISKAAGHKPDLVLMDVRLQSEMDGVEAAGRIRESLDVPVVFLTAYADEPTLRRAKATLPYGYVLKPFDERELRIVIELTLYRHDMERRLRESEAWVHAALRSVGDAVLATDGEGRIKFMNPLAEFLTGWKQEDALGLDVSRVFKTVGQATPDSLSGPPPETEVIVAKDGTERAIESVATPIRDEKDRLGGVVWTFRDITERKRVQDGQRLMAETSATLSSSLDYETTIAKATAPVVPLLADWCIVDLLEPDGSISPVATTHANPDKAHDLCQLGRRSISNLDIDYGVIHVIRTGRAELYTEVESRTWLAHALAVDDPALLSTLTAQSLLCVPLSAHSDKRVWGALTLASERPGRQYGQFDLLLAEDLARRIAIAIDNSRLYQDAQRALRLREDMLAIVAHDLRTPLANILISSEMVARKASTADDAIKQRAAGMVRTAGRMQRLVSDLLDMGKIDAGRLSIDEERWPVSELVHEAVDMFEPRALEKSLRLAIATSPDALAGLQVRCDRDRVLQIFSNLIGNAIKFTSEGGSIDISAERIDAHVRFAVKDDGPGISSEQRQHLFERYSQAPETRRKGTGLGLYIAKGIVEAHGGRIWVESSPPAGSTFYFNLRVAETGEQYAPGP